MMAHSFTEEEVRKILNEKEDQIIDKVFEEIEKKCFCHKVEDEGNICCFCVLKTELEEKLKGE